MVQYIRKRTKEKNGAFDDHLRAWNQLFVLSMGAFSRSLEIFLNFWFVADSFSFLATENRPNAGAK